VIKIKSRKYYMENELLPHLIIQQKKREKLIQLYYKTGRPIFNSIQDKKHIYYKSDVDNCKRGYYY
jgi:hypothetical protein